jgi:CubicO group peptidase (beta-lactamase class C family)
MRLTEDRNMRRDRDDDGRAIPRRTWLSTMSTLALSACAAPRIGGTEARDELPSPAREDVSRLMRLASVPGLSTGVVHRDDISTLGYGVRRAGADEPVDGDTIFEAASLSKPVFAYAVMQLVAAGKIDLDRPIGSYVALPDPSDERAKAVTVRHALSHTSGWPNWRSQRDAKLVSAFTPGSRFSYSGEGYYFVQRIVETVTGHGLARVMRERVLEPLGMNNSSYLWRPSVDPHLSTPHSGSGEPMTSNSVKFGRAVYEVAAKEGRASEDFTSADMEASYRTIQPGVQPAQPVFPVNLAPNAAFSLLTTARDYAIFVRHLLGDGRPMLERMMAPQITINESLRWGLGLGIETIGGRSTFWHWGDNPGYKNFITGDRRDNSAIVIFTNANSGQAVYERVVRAETGKDRAAFLWI